MPAGLRKMPEPIVVPITTAMALQRPMRPVNPDVAGAADVVITRNYAAGLRAGSPDRDISRVADTLTSLPALLFWLCAAAIIIAQVRILRSTRRAWRVDAAKAAPGIAEWSFAVGPVIVLGVLLWATYRAMLGLAA
jgi:ABC-type dipeptide/oligopeptide/nickel transport system permease subunit